MKITVKRLQGEECTLEVQPSTFICDIKKKVHSQLNIPEDEQKLLLNGKTLADDQMIDFYPTIQEGTKLNLIVKKPEFLQEAVLRCFRRKLKEPKASKAATKFMKLIHQKFDILSLDDIERLADCFISNNVTSND